MSKHSWSSNDSANTNDLAWGDMDDDGNLDLAVASSSEGLKVYHNKGKMIADKPFWTSSVVNDTRSISWADMNGDGFMDLVSNSYSGLMYVYLNDNGSFKLTPSWQQRGAGQKTVRNYLIDLNGDGRTDAFEC
jgi:hypothetical protein